MRNFSRQLIPKMGRRDTLPEDAELDKLWQQPPWP